MGPGQPMMVAMAPGQPMAQGAVVSGTMQQQQQQPGPGQPQPPQQPPVLKLVEEAAGPEIAVDHQDSVKALESANALDKGGRDKILKFLSSQYRPQYADEEIKLSSKKDVSQMGVIVRLEETHYVLCKSQQVKLITRVYSI